MGKRIDLTGQRFGRLTVIGLNEEVSKQKRRSYWNCKCDCGNEKVVDGANLRRGDTTSCGCLQKENVRKKTKDLTGMKYGRLTVIERRGSDKHRNALWLCKCECGNECVVSGVCLKNGDTTSCGCYKKEKCMEQRIDLTGQRFGRLVVVSYNEEVSKQKKGSHWNCKCECGNECVVGGKNLRRGNTTSCGCLQKERTEETWKDEEYRQMKSDKMRELNEKRWQDEEYRQMQSEVSSKTLKKLWQDEEMKWKMGYKGGITPISAYLRHLPIVVKWKEDAKENVNYTCELIGKQCYVETHHIKPFCELVIEAHVLNGIQIKEIIADYTEEELKLLVAYITKWHQDFSNAIVLSKEVHRYFHNVFMKGKDRESSVEDVKEFKQCYLNGEFKDLLGGDLND